MENKTNYYRITGYCPNGDFCFIMDCYGCFEKLWQFSSFLLQKGIEIVEVGGEDKFIGGNITRAEYNSEQLILRANAPGKPNYITTTAYGVTYPAVQVGDKYYIPDRNKRA